jgi:hypothetical protein
MPKLRAGSIAWPDLGHGPHPAIVLRIDDGCLWIAVGTSKPRELIGVMVKCPSPTATMLGLRATTYFYAQSIQLIDAVQFQPTASYSPPGLLAELSQMLLQNARHMLEKADSGQHAAVECPRLVSVNPSDSPRDGG